MSKRSKKGKAVPEFEANSAHESPAHGEAWRFAILASGIAFVCFLLFTLAYGSRGEAWVNGLDDRLGELVAWRARALLNAGKTDEAIAEFDRAIAAGFRYPDEGMRTAQTLTGALLREGRHSDAATLARTALTYGDSNGVSYGHLIAALKPLARHQEIVETAQEFRAWAEARGDANTVSSSYFHEGEALEKLGKAEEAIAAYQAGFAAKAGAQNALASATLLIKLGRQGEAAKFRDYVRAHGTPVERAAAEALDPPL